MLARRLTTGPVVATVVGVVPVHDARESARAGERCEVRVQLGLAVIAAVRGIRPVIRVLELTGLDELVRQPELTRQRERELPVGIRITRTLRRDGQRPGTKHRCGRAGQVGAVHAAAERDNDGVDVGEEAVEEVRFGAHLGGNDDRVRACHDVGRRSACASVIHFVIIRKIGY